MFKRAYTNIINRFANYKYDYDNVFFACVACGTTIGFTSGLIEGYYTHKESVYNKNFMRRMRVSMVPIYVNTFAGIFSGCMVGFTHPVTIPLSVISFGIFTIYECIDRY